MTGNRPVSIRVRNEVWNEVWNDILKQVRKQIWHQVDDKVRELVTQPVLEVQRHTRHVLDIGIDRRGIMVVPQQQ